MLAEFERGGVHCYCYLHLSQIKQDLSFLRKCMAALSRGSIGLICVDLLYVLHSVWHMVLHSLGVGVGTSFMKDRIIQKITLCRFD